MGTPDGYTIIFIALAIFVIWRLLRVVLGRRPVMKIRLFVFWCVIVFVTLWLFTYLTV
jgi:hypothetical protein